MEPEGRPMTIKERMALLDQEKKKAAAVQTSAAPSDLPSTTGKLNVKSFLSNPGVRCFTQHCMRYILRVQNVVNYRPYIIALL
jgi:hypothetical protein